MTMVSSGDSAVVFPIAWGSATPSVYEMPFVPRAAFAAEFAHLSVIVPEPERIVIQPHKPRRMLTAQERAGVERAFWKSVKIVG